MASATSRVMEAQTGDVPEEGALGPGALEPESYVLREPPKVALAQA
jgi:hypothetical protein